MHARRHYFAAAFALDGQLYAAGGFEWSGGSSPPPSAYDAPRPLVGVDVDDLRVDGAA